MNKIGLLAACVLIGCDAPLLCDLLGWVDSQGYIMLESVAGGVDARGLDLQSSSGRLVPIPPGDLQASAAPFSFLLANNANQVTYATLGTAVSITDQMVLSAMYDVSGDVMDPCGDLTLTWGNPTFRFCSLPGDVNFDGGVTFADFLVVSENFGMTGAEWPHGDFDWDQEVQFSDYLLLAEHFGRQLEHPDPPIILSWIVPVPEPASSCGLWIGLCAVVGCFRRGRG